MTHSTRDPEGGGFKPISKPAAKQLMFFETSCGMTRCARDPEGGERFNNIENKPLPAQLRLFESSCGMTRCARDPEGGGFKPISKPATKQLIFFEPSYRDDSLRS
jgi:hypothetical protein